MAGCTDFDPIRTTNKLTVEQCDRDAMESILWVHTIIDDRYAIAQAFARHRQQAEARAEELVAALEKIEVMDTDYTLGPDHNLERARDIAAKALTAYRSARP